VFAVPHRGSAEAVLAMVDSGRVSVLIDVKGAIARARVPGHVHYWRL
jgi:hypothetical protein